MKEVDLDGRIPSARAPLGPGGARCRASRCLHVGDSSRPDRPGLAESVRAGIRPTALPRRRGDGQLHECWHSGPLRSRERARGSGEVGRPTPAASRGGLPSDGPRPAARSSLLPRGRAGWLGQCHVLLRARGIPRAASCARLRPRRPARHGPIRRDPAAADPGYDGPEQRPAGRWCPVLRIGGAPDRRRRSAPLHELDRRGRPRPGPGRPRL